MSWMKMLYDTYDQNEGEIANFKRENYLCPIAHMTASSQIEITVDIQGEFHSARQITDRGDAETIIPVTDESAGRASGIAPHPLCDNLTYVAGDYVEYISVKKDVESSKGRFEEYIKALEKWQQSPYTCKKIQGIYQYVTKKSMIKDLIGAGIIVLDETGQLSKEKIAGRSYDKCIVRFRILGSGQPEECWQDKSLFQAYQTYYLEQRKEYGRSDICYLTGKQAVTSENHPKGILPASYGAKLVSANDNTDFTFRGRFRTGEEAYAVSYEATQKAHNALKWLAKIQGYIVGMQDKRTYICWNTKGKKVVQIDELGYLTDDEDDRPSTMPEYKQKLQELIEGYRDQFDDTDEVALMALEAATTGRLSIVYYNQLLANDYFERIRDWHEHCCWQFTTFDQAGNPKQEIKTPTIKRMVEYTFGVQQGDFVKVSDKLMIMQYQRLFHCIVDKQSIPHDFVEAIFHRACQPLGYSFGNRERLLSIACAMIAKYYYDKNDKEGINMEVDKNINDRDYLYGRLLAVYEKLERSTYGKDEKREPNAIRLQTVYAQHPASTRLIIENALNPYFQRLSPQSREFYRKEIEEISNKISLDMENKQLGYKYLIGYWAERADLRKKNDDAKKVEEE